MTIRPQPTGTADIARRTDRRWWILLLICLSFAMMTLNWFNMSGALADVSETFALPWTSVTLLVSLFTVAYGAMAIPGGLLMTRFGIRTVLATGLCIEGLGAVLSAFAPSFEILLVTRIVGAFGASIVAVTGMPAIYAWFPKRQFGLCFGIASAAFMIGATAGLNWWGNVTEALGWRASIGAAGLLCLSTGIAVAVLYRIPAGSTSLKGVTLTGRVVRETVGNRRLWVYGIAFIGSYGGYYAGAQLMSTYGSEERQFDGSVVSTAAMIVGLAGIPGALIGGWITDRLTNRGVVFALSSMSVGVFLALFPFVSSAWFWLPALGIAFVFNFSYAIWATVPPVTSSISPENLGTAVGVMLTIAAVGGFIGPYLFSLIIPVGGYTFAWVAMGGFAAVMSLVALADRTRPRSTVQL